MAGFCHFQIERAYLSRMERTFHTSEYTDFLITCNGGAFPVHKAILAVQWDFHRVVADYGVEVSPQFHGRLRRLILSQKSKEHTADFLEEDPEAIGLILHYLYTGVYMLEPTEAFFKWMASVTSTPRITGVDTPPSDTTSQADSITSFSPSYNIRRHILAYRAAETMRIKAVQKEIYSCFTGRGSCDLIHKNGLLEQLELLYDATWADGDKLRAWVNQECLELRSSLLLSRPDVVSVIAEWEPELIVTMYQSEIEQLKTREEVLTEGNEAEFRTLSEKIGHLERTTTNLQDEIASLTDEISALTMDNESLLTENRDLKARPKNLKGD